MIVQRELSKNSFYKSIRWVLVFGQMCGLIPVKGIFGPDHRRLRFTWKNPIFFYALFLIGMTIFFDYALTKEIMSQEIKLDSLAPTAFYSICLLASLMFLNLARKFPQLATDFYELEKNMAADYGYPKNLGLKTKIFIVLFASLAIVEHGTMAVLVSKRAERLSQSEDISFGHAFFKCMFREVSVIVPYSPVLFVMIFYTNVICTLTWNYLDFFLIAISMQISSRLKLINDRVSKVDMKRDNRHVWSKILQNYNQLSILIKKLDKLLSKIILTSLVNDIYHVTLQLLRSLKIQGSIFQNLYFYFSMFYLIARLITLSFSLAQVEDESKKSLDYLYCIKEPTVESNRFLTQIATDDVYFTGNQFFVINRKFMITVIGTLVTYQVILLQVESLKFYSD